ncbi:MAG: hypothetical protein ACJASX_000941 [Limisphaerales bacterium]|jgi:hypothetical protein
MPTPNTAHGVDSGTSTIWPRNSPFGEIQSVHLEIKILIFQIRCGS